jgi:hypothetical protein
MIIKRGMLKGSTCMTVFRVLRHMKHIITVAACRAYLIILILICQHRNI